MNVPMGYIKLNRLVSVEVRKQLTEDWRKAWHHWNTTGIPPIISEPAEFVPLPQTNIVPDAICRYCTVANLNSAVWCQGCGAPMVRP